MGGSITTMLTTLHRQVQTLSGELDRYRAGGSSAQRSFEQLKAEKEAVHAQLRRDFDQLSEKHQSSEATNSKLTTQLQNATEQLQLKEVSCEQMAATIRSLEHRLEAADELVTALRVAMKSTTLEARHSEHRAVRTAQQSHSDAEASMRVAMRQAQELEAQVGVLEDQAEASQKKLADKNSAIERLHSQLLLLTTNEAGRAAELADVRSKLESVQGRALHMNELMAQARQERAAALKKKDVVIDRLRRCNQTEQLRSTEARRSLGAAIFARITHEGLSSSATNKHKPSLHAPTPPKQPAAAAKSKERTIREQRMQKRRSKTSQPIAVRAVMDKVRDLAAEKKQDQHSVMRLFSLRDTNNTGLLAETDFKDALEQMGVLSGLADDEFATLATANWNNSGLYRYAQFVDAYLQQAVQLQPRRRPATARAANRQSSARAPARSVRFETRLATDRSMERTNTAGSSGGSSTGPTNSAKVAAEWLPDECIGEDGEWADAYKSLGKA